MLPKTTRSDIHLAAWTCKAVATEPLDHVLGRREGLPHERRGSVQQPSNHDDRPLHGHVYYGLHVSPFISCVVVSISSSTRRAHPSSLPRTADTLRSISRCLPTAPARDGTAATALRAPWI